MAVLAVGLPVTASAEEEPEFSVLVFSKTAGFRHASIPAGITMFENLATEHGFQMVHSEDATILNDEDLAAFDAVVMFQTSGNGVWNAEQEAALQRYLEGGGGFVAVHNALDMGDSQAWSPWWDDLMGTTMTQHSAGVQQATVKVADRVHPSTASLPERWTFSDEWYNFDVNPRGDVHVLATVDETTYDPGSQAKEHDHPISWCRTAQGGRVWASAMGHAAAAYSNADFQAHILGGLRWAAGAADGECGGTVWENFEKVALDTNVGQPMELDVAAGGQVFFTQRTGAVKVIDPETQLTSVAANLPVDTTGEGGLQGIALDPNFAENQWLYLYYAAPDENEKRLSRFTMNGDTLDLGSEVVLLEVPTAWPDRPAHVGGSVEFGPDGNLYLSTGDDTPPWRSDGYAPIDERPGESAFDAQRTSANSNDLRGKLLRITPVDTAEGGYTIPDSNMFAEADDADDKTRPEIYAMGFRNPFRFSFDPESGEVVLADYGPDARNPNPDRGPAGLVEWQRISEPGFYGWPYCHGDNVAYRDYDFATGESGPAFDCANPVNESPNNSGLTQLPASVPAEVWYSYNLGNAGEFPEMGSGGGIAPMAGPVYDYDPELASDTKFPEYFDGKAFVYEWARHFLREFAFDSSGDVMKISPFLSGVRFNGPMDMVFGPDGSMYVAEWGRGYGRDNPDDGIYRIDYVQGGRSPVAKANGTPVSGQPPLEVEFSSAGSDDPDEGQDITYAWDFGDGATSTEPNPTHVYTERGDYTAQLTVTDPTGKTGVANVPIAVGNTAPTVELAAPVEGGFFDFGDEIAFDVNVSDPEDGEIDCSEVLVQPRLGHDEHSHPLEQYHACEGVLAADVSGHGEGNNLYYVLTAEYTDHGAEGVDPLTGGTSIVLQPKHRQAEHFTSSSGVEIEQHATAQDGARVGSIDDGDWIAFDPVNLHRMDGVSFRASSATGGGVIEVRANSPDGILLGSQEIASTSGYVDLPPTALTDPGTTIALYLVFRTDAGSQFDLDAMTFTGKGVSVNARPYVRADADSAAGTAPLTVDFTADASDPEGEDVTLAWNFGDGTTSTEPNVTHTYAEPGDYVATVNATDAQGATGSDEIVVRVDPEAPVCLGPRSDEFDGDALNTVRWPTVRLNEGDEAVVGNGLLTLPSADGEIAGATNDGLNLVAQPAPTDAWEATTKVTFDAHDAYHQAGLMLHTDDDNYVKVNMAGRAGGDRVATMLAERGVQRVFNQAVPLPADFPTTFYVRFSSDGSELTGAISADGEEWTTVASGLAVSEFPDPDIGVFSMKGRRGAATIPASFDWFRLSAAGGTGVDDEFDGTQLNACRWDRIVRHEPEFVDVADGHLSVVTHNADINGPDNSRAPRNFILQDGPDGDWTIETKLTAPLTERYQLAGLMVYADDDHYVKYDVVANNPASNPTDLRIELRKEDGGALTGPGVADIDPPGEGETTTWWLRLTKEGDTYTGQISADGQTWIDSPGSVTVALDDPAFGLLALGPRQTAPVTVQFDHFRLIDDEPAPDETPPTVGVDIDGRLIADGEYRAPVRVAATADDGDGSGVASIEYALDGGEWQAFDKPFVLGQPGEHEIRVRATDEAGNASEEFQQTFTLAAGDDATVTIGLLSDTHVRDTSRAEITGWADQQQRYEQFTTSMNSEVDPDFVVQLGDLNDGQGSENDAVRWIGMAKSAIHEPLDALTLDVLGNHEYRKPQQFDEQRILGALNEHWDETSDTWYAFTYQGVTFIVLNTAFTDTASHAHTAPMEEVEWLRDTLAASDQPTFAFMHVPASAGCGDAYDQFVNQDLVSQAFAEDEEFVAGFFGHSHHCDEWDRLSTQLDDYGNRYYHVTQPHQWMDDASQVPWGVVELNTEQNRMVFRTGSGVDDPQGLTVEWDHPVVRGPLDSDHHLSNLEWSSASNQVGPTELDMSSGGQTGLDGTALTIDGETYAKGLGVHAPSEIVYQLGGTCGRFVSDVGVDDETGGAGSVTFEVWADGERIYDSGVVDAATGAKSVDVGVSGVEELRLVVTDAGDGRGSDHADWAGAIVRCGDLAPPDVQAQLDGETEADGDYVDTAELTLLADDGDDGSGVDQVQWRPAGDGEPALYEAPVIFDEPGRYTVEYRASDLAGNTGDWRSVSFTVVPRCDGTVVIGDQDSGVTDRKVHDGQCLSDAVDADRHWESHGAFVAHVVELTAQLHREGDLSKDERIDLVRAAARSDVGRPEESE